MLMDGAKEMLLIEYQQTSYLPTKNEEALINQIEHVLQYAYNKQGEFIKRDWEMSIIFTDNEQIQALNKEYRAQDRATDVLSFAFNEGEDAFVYPADAMMPLGDVFISVERAREQADSYAHSLERELVFLALHGFLHLLGYDHLNEADEREMFGLQETILTALKIER